MGKRTFFIELKAKAGKRDELWALWQERLLPKLEAIPEAEVIVPCFDRDDEETIRIFELFDNENTPREIVTSDWFEAFRKEIEPLLEEPSVVSVGIPQWEKK